MIALGRVVSNASPYTDDTERMWIKEVSMPETTFDSLADTSERFYPLDNLLAVALMNMLPPALKLKVNRKEAVLDEQNLLMTGRQILFMVRESFRTEAHMDVYYNIQDLLAVKWTDDTAMPLFLQRWDSVTDGMGPEFIQDRLLRDLFLEQVSRSKVLADDVAHYHRLKPEDEHKTLDFLRDAVERSIKLSEDKAVVTERQKTWRSNTTAVISTTETPKAAAKPPKDNKTGVTHTSKTPDRPKQG